MAVSGGKPQFKHKPSLYTVVSCRSHLVTVPPGPLLSEALVNSPVIVGEDGAGVPLQASGFEFGVDPNEDPELALALRVSMEEQRARQEEEARKVGLIL